MKSGAASGSPTAAVGPTPPRDEVLARLLELKSERAAEEAHTGKSGVDVAAEDGAVASAAPGRASVRQVPGGRAAPALGDVR